MKLKNAFSLAEILLVLAIIGVVTATGLSISRHNAESAYNLYFYTGYIGLSDAITDTVKRAPLAEDRDEFLNELASKFNTTYSSTNLSIHPSIQAHNGITYEDLDTHIITIDKQYNAVIFKMTVPQLNGNKTTHIVYIPDYNGGMILPTEKLPGDDNEISLQDRRDLLPFYINDGLGNFNGNREFLSYRDAYCRVYGSRIFIPSSSKTGSNNNNINIISCSTTGNSSGIITPVNPRKVW